MTKLATSLLCFTLLLNNLFAETVSKINCADEDYNTLQLWEDDKDGTLSDIQTASCYDDQGDLTAGVTIAGSLAGATFYMKITAPVGERHDGTDGSGFCINPSGTGDLIIIDDHYVVIEWLELTDWAGDWAEDNAIYSSEDNYLTIRNNLIHTPIGGDADCYAGGILLNYFGTNCKIYNNIIYETGAEGMYKGIKCAYSDDTNLIYNNTIINMSISGAIGIQSEHATFEPMLINNYVGNCVTDYSGYFNASSSNNISEDATGDDWGSNCSTGAVIADQFDSVTSGSEDLHLKTGADCIDAGTSLSGTFTNDIDNDTRSGTWDVGADEVVAAVTPAAKDQAIQIQIFED